MITNRSANANEKMYLEGEREKGREEERDEKMYQLVS